MSTPEGKVKDKVKLWFKQRAAWFYMPMQNGMGVQGIPDFIACVPMVITQDMVGATIGVFYGVETKAPGRITNTSPLQKIQLQGIAAAHGYAAVVDDVTQITAPEDYLWQRPTS